MPGETIKIGVVAPGSRIDRIVAERVEEIAAGLVSERAIEIHFHPQCFLASGHFAGDDAARAAAFLDIANDESFDALWFARGGYGACRMAETAIAQLAAVARTKLYLGYSDAGSLLAGLYKEGFPRLAHGPMPSDILRAGGAAAVKRALAYLIDRAPDALEASVSADTPTAAFNIAVLSHLLGTPLQPDLTGHVLMLEERAEYMYGIDRYLFHITSNPGIRRVAGIRLGRCSEIPENDPDFGQTEEEVTRHWCDVSGIPYLGRADIGHDVDNKVVPFGRPQAA
ncbi:MAG: LD-carboxypeptidase [Alphaproteobacteria bacterium]|nr:LD-carboxypeptidase [Alphaproteobacteria bacterium]